MLQRIRRFLLRVSGFSTSRIFNRYLSGSGSKMLHLGCGENFLPGWLNTDCSPRRSDVMWLDARSRFPFPDSVFDCAFSEHMIEHITYHQGLDMLRECCRILKPGGRIRISTPNMAFLVELCRPDKSQLQREYITWTLAQFAKNMPFDDETFLVNVFYRAFGHLFIHSEKTLRNAMEVAGFTLVTRCELGESDYPDFRRLENEGRMPPGFLRLETITMEGFKL